MWWLFCPKGNVGLYFEPWEAATLGVAHINQNLELILGVRNKGNLVVGPSGKL